MKKIYYILTLVAAAMTISACNNTFEEEGPAIDGGNSANKITLTIGTETDTEVRTALDLTDGQTAIWNGTEKAGLYYNYRAAGAGSDTKVASAQNIVYTATVASNTATATFTGDAEWQEVDADAHKFYFYYPYNEASASHTKIQGTLPAEQSYDATADYWDMSAYDFVYANNSKATPDEPVELKIKRAFAVLRLGITNSTGDDVEIKKVTLTSESGKILAGEFIANISKGAVDQALSSHDVANGSNYGYWTSTASSITTTVSNGAVKSGEKIDVRLMLNAGYAPQDASPYYDEETPYLKGDTFTVTIVTNKGTHPEVSFTAGALLRGQRAGKSIVLDAVPAGEPNATSVVSNDSSKDKYYLNNTITITGTNLLNAQAVKVGGVAAEVVSQTGTELVVKVPDCTGTATIAATYDITYTYNGKDGVLDQINIYPFYHYEDIMLGLGSDSSKTYTDYACENSFFVPDLGKVISSKEWYDTPIDTYVINAETTAIANGIAEKSEVANSALSAKNTLNKSAITEEEYYAVMPYLFFLSNSDGYISSAAPANSNSVLRNHYIKNDSGSFKNIISYKIFGTPIIYYRVASEDWAGKVKEGTLETMNYNGNVPNSTTPYLKGTSKTDGVWTEGDVLVMGYATYTKGAKPSKVTDCAKIGFIYIKEVTCADLTTGLSLSPREGHIKFDFYWSKKLN